MIALLALAAASLLAVPAQVSAEPVLVAVDHPPAGTAASLLDDGVMVVRDLDRFLLAVTESDRLEALDRAGLSWEVLDSAGPGASFYTVGVRDRETLAAVNERVRVLRWDGWEAVIAAPPDRAERLAADGLEIAKVFLRPIRPAPAREAMPRLRALTPDPRVQVVVDAVSGAQVDAGVQRLQDFVTRYAPSDSCQAAADWIKAQFESYGIDSVYFQDWSATYKPNVVAVIPGKAFPQKKVVIGGHYDSVTGNVNDCPGADDDASGTACVLECARVLAGGDFNYTLVFVAFCAEEQGLLGSEAFAAAAAAAGDDIVAAVAVDMIGYVAPGDPTDLDLIDNASSTWIRDLAVDVGTAYVPGLPLVDGAIPGGASSDHASFWAHGYDAILLFEDTGSYSPYIHTANDVVGTSYNDSALAEGSVRVAAGLLATLAQPFQLAMAHVPLGDTEDTASPYRVTAQIVAAGPLATGGLQVFWATPTSSGSAPLTATGNPDEYEGWIPAQPGGTWVDYWLQAEDQTGFRVTDPATAPAETHRFFVGTVTTFLADDFEAGSGWTAGLAGDNATTGLWVWADPHGTWSGSVPVQPEDDATPSPGTMCFVTGNAGPGAAQGDDDVDGGRTTLLSPVYDLTGLPNAHARYRRWYSNDTGSDPGTDVFRAGVSTDGGATWTNLESTSASDRSWLAVDVSIGDLVALTSQMQFRFIASDAGNGSIVEAGLDDFSIVVYQETATAVAIGPAVARLSLAPCRPNPFDGSTAIHFNVPPPGRPVRLTVFDVTGRKVALLLDAGNVEGARTIVWDGRDDSGTRVGTGVYFYRLDAGEETRSRKAVVLRR